MAGRTRQEWETLVGEKVLNRVGALAIIIGSGFFLKYAIDRNWINPLARVLIGLAAGLALIVFASLRRKALPVFTQGLLATGVCILYLSVYAAFGWYGLISKTAAFVLMAGVTALSVERAVRFDSLAVGVLGWAGGYLTPLLLAGAGSGGSGTGDSAGLFTYLLLLQAGFLTLAMKKPSRWHILERLSLGGSWFVYFLWYLRSSSEGGFWAATTFVTLSWLMFLGTDIYLTVRNDEEGEAERSILSWLNGALFYGFLYLLINDHYPQFRAPATLAVAVVYTAPMIILRRPFPAYGVRAAVLVAIATGLQFRGLVLAAAWTLEGFAMLCLGLRMGLLHVRLVALGFYVIGAAALVLAPGSLAFMDLDGYIPVFNVRALAYGLVALLMGAGCAAYGWLSADRDFAHQSSDDATTIEALRFGWIATVFVLVTVEILDYFRIRGQQAISVASPDFVRDLTLAAAWAVFSTGLVWAGVARQNDLVARAGIALGVVAGALALFKGLVFVPPESYRPLLNARVLALLFIGVTQYLTIRLLDRADERIWQWDSLVFNAAVALILFVLVTGETRDFFEKAIALDGWSARLASRQQLALSAGWLAYAAVALGLGFALRKWALRIAGVCLLLLTILKVFLFDLSFLQQLHRIFSFIALGVILLAASYLYQRYKEVIFGQAQPE